MVVSEMYWVNLSFDFDAYSSWIARGLTNYTNLSRGEFASIGVKRILKMLREYNIRATFFIPGHTAEHFPEDVGMIRDGGHEIGHHGYIHEPPETINNPKEEKRVIELGIESLKRVANVIPKGYRSPSWALTRYTLSILEDLGFIYDSSLMGNDYTPYRPHLYVYVEEGGRIVKGPLSRLIEIPIHWSLDDFPHFEYIRFPNYILQGLRSVSDVLENWTLDYEYMVRNLDEGVIAYTFHPEVIGRGHRIIFLERLIRYIKDHPKHREVEFQTLEEIAKIYRKKLE
jgi:peptidoglycan/xylan/chitin deacetylase (PgdA/CDA1 family)